MRRLTEQDIICQYRVFPARGYKLVMDIDDAFPAGIEVAASCVVGVGEYLDPDASDMTTVRKRDWCDRVRNFAYTHFNNDVSVALSFLRHVEALKAERLIQPYER